MALPPPPPSKKPQDASIPAPSGSAPAVSGRKEPEIVTIPEKFYGMALKMKAEPEKKEPSEAAKPPVKPASAKVSGPLPKRRVWPYIVLVLVLLLSVGGGFVYFNRDLLFRAPVQEPPAEPEPPVVSPPSAPANLVASATSGTVAVSIRWVDTSGDETGYRIERREGAQGTFIPLTNLSINSTTFLDVTVQPEHVYTYRVIATGPGGESSPSNEATATAGVLETPQGTVLPPGGLDSDSDGLTDVEESVYGTDARNPDTDADGFLDGNEVFHLYNPAATAPVRLLDSGIVKEVQASSGWSVMVPRDWVANLTPPDGARATIRSGSGETFTVRLEDNPEDLSLRDWYNANTEEGSSRGTPREITTKGGLSGLLGNDRLTAYFAWDGKIFILHYELGQQEFISYRTTFEMMLNALALEGAPILTGEEVTDLEGPGEFVETSDGVPESDSATSTPDAAEEDAP